MSQIYSEFFNLEANPFGETPDGRFYFDSATHNAALNQLSWAIGQGRGFMLLTGEVGSGKTLISRILLNELAETANTALILFPKLSEPELLAAIGQEFEVPNRSADGELETPGSYLDSLNRFLLESASQGRKCVLIVDEAQNLSFEALETIRLLSNLETERHKLLQIVLLAQPELRAALETQKLRQLNQRICVNLTLQPFSRTETERYVKHRLEIAGSGNLIRFQPSATQLIHERSGGMPRLINKCCEKVIQLAQSQRVRLIDRRLACAALEEPGRKRRLFGSWFGSEARQP